MRRRFGGGEADAVALTGQSPFGRMVAPLGDRRPQALPDPHPPFRSAEFLALGVRPEMIA